MNRLLFTSIAGNLQLKTLEYKISDLIITILKLIHICKYLIASINLRQTHYRYFYESDFR